MITGENASRLITPYGGKLVNLLADEDERCALLLRANGLHSIQISARSACDLELLAIGAFSPLDRFMGEQDYRMVLNDMRMTDGTLMPIPVTLPVDSVDGLEYGSELVLRGPTNDILAVMRLEDIFAWDRKAEYKAVLGTTDSRHPLVSEMHTWGRYLLSGPMTVVNLPRHADFTHIRRTPAEVRDLLETRQRPDIIAYQPRHPMHRPHETLTKSVAAEVGGSLLIQPVAGSAGYADMEHFTRVRCYEALIDNYYEAEQALLNLVPLAVRMAGPRAGLWHGIINRNYGANYCILGRDPHGPRKDSQGDPFYSSRDVQNLYQAHEAEIGVRMIPHREMVYMRGDDRYEESDRIANRTDEHIRISETNVVEDYMFLGKLLPDWFTYPEVAQILLEAHPPRNRQGFCVWLTGLPSSGKSTIADALASLLPSFGRRVSVLDGDVVRTHLTKGLGFGREDRITNVLRVGFVAAEVVRHQGVVICALISPHAFARDQVRAMIGAERFIEVFVDTPVSVCERRDVKGMYTMAKQGRIAGFTGVDDVYEPPRSPEVLLHTVDAAPEESARQILEVLVRKGFVEIVEKPAKQGALQADAFRVIKNSCDEVSGKEEGSHAPTHTGIKTPESV